MKMKSDIERAGTPAVAVQRIVRPRPMLCAKCHSPATFGTMKYPLCESCLKKHFAGDHDAYWLLVGKHLG